jgi:small subunit ribosomal protein S8
MFANIKNGQIAKKKIIYHTKQKNCENFLKLLWREGFILGYKYNAKDANQLKIFLKYYDGKPAINAIQSISRPGRRIYYSIKQIWKIDSSKLFIIVSTNQGLKSIVECKKLKIGGEPVIILK